MLVPEDISLVSFDDQPYTALLASPMTTVEQEKDEIARSAVNILLEIITAEDVNKTIKNLMVKPKLIIRHSVKKLIQ